MSYSRTGTDANWRKLLKNAKELQKSYVNVGLLEGKAVAKPQALGSGHKPITSMEEMVKIAAVQEFGSETGNIPARPFMRPAVTENRERIYKLQKELGLKVLQHETTKTAALKKLGLEIVLMVRKTIKQVNAPPLAANTSERKAGDKPLIDRWQMYNSIGFDVGKDE